MYDLIPCAQQNNLGGSQGSEQRRRAPRVGLKSNPLKGHSIIDRFWARVQKSPDPDGCWIFAGAKCSPAGHVHISLDQDPLSLKKAKRIGAHRFSYELHKGPIPNGLVVMHRCDVPACVNPDHLELGTQRDNIHDAIDKGRFAPWLHPNSIAAKSRPRQRRTEAR